MLSGKTKKSIKSLGMAHRKLIAFIVIIALAVGAYFVYQAVALRINKHDFQKARTAIDTIYADIVSKVGQPDDQKIVNNCTRTYQEFTGYSAPTCHVDTILIYGVKDGANANQQFKKIQNIVSAHADLLKPSRPLSKSITDQFVVDTINHAASDTYSLGSLHCVANYVYDTPDETFLEIKDTSNKSLQITIGCYGPARQQYYPLAY